MKPESDGEAADEAPPSPEPAGLSPFPQPPSPGETPAGSHSLRLIEADEAMNIALQVSFDKSPAVCGRAVRLIRDALRQSGFQIVKLATLDTDSSDLVLRP